MNDLVVGIISGAFGMAYLVYGRRQSKIVAAVAGVLLCVYPYFIDGLLLQCAIGGALLVAPFLVDF